MDLRNKISAHQHRTKRFSTEKMNMKVWDLLMAIDPGIGEQPVTGCYQTLFPRDMAHRTDESGNFCVGCFGAEIIPTDIGTLRDHKNVDGCLRVYIVKGQRPFIFIDGAIGNFAAQDLREDILVIIGQSGVNGHASSFPAGFFVNAGCAFAALQFLQDIVEAQPGIRQQYR